MYSTSPTQPYFPPSYKSAAPHPYANYDRSPPPPPPPAPDNGIYVNRSGSTQPRNPADVAASVKALLLGTKQLQDVLKRWSLGQGTEAEVSDVYVQLGTDFNTVVHAFGYYGIDTSDLHSVPKDLRMVLEQCLGEDPTPQTLGAHMPEIRRILYGLLGGLKAKEPVWRASGSKRSF